MEGYSQQSHIYQVQTTLRKCQIINQITGVLSGTHFFGNLFMIMKVTLGNNIGWRCKLEIWIKWKAQN